MKIPHDLYYSKEHTWVRVENGIGTIGITEFAQSELGEIVYPDLPNIDSNFSQDEVFGSVEAVKTVSDLFMPISGKIIETNQILLKAPTLINDNPYGDGWLIKIEIEDSNELKKLLTAGQYAKTYNP